jgi:DNA-binding NtrC family response regulator
MTKILVIDDDASDRGLLVAVLEERGYEVILADKVGAGLMLCHRGTPDAVVLDLNMPGIDGRSLLRQLRILHPTYRSFTLALKPKFNNKSRATFSYKMSCASSIKFPHGSAKNARRRLISTISKGSSTMATPRRRNSAIVLLMSSTARQKWW